MKTIALNMIVGPGDGKLLTRCLNSFDVKKCFDEIVFIVTTGDAEIWEEAKKWTDKTYRFTWSTAEHPFGNFGGARALAVEKTVSDYIMWLDADDVINGKDTVEKFEKLKANLEKNEVDFLFVPYVLSLDKNGNPKDVLIRERIFSKKSGISWTQKVHEQMTITPLHKKIVVNGIQVTHCPAKSSDESLARNIKILWNDYQKEKNDHNTYYLGRDLMLAGKTDSAYTILRDYVCGYDGSQANIFEAALMLTEYLMYKRGESGIRTIEISDYNEAMRYANIAYYAGTPYAEPEVYKGDLCFYKEKIDEAEQHYKLAMGKDFGKNGLSRKEFYEAMPAVRLSFLSVIQGKYEEALFYIKVALEHYEKQKDLLALRSETMQKLQDIYG